MGNYHFTVQFIFSQIIHKNQNKRKIFWRMSVIDYKDFKDNFVIRDKLGKGNCASVVQVQHKKSLQLFALKYSRYSTADKLATAFQQLQVVRALDHPAAIQIYYCFVKSNNSIMNNQVIEFGMIMELAIRNLEEDMNQRKKNLQFYTQFQIQQLTINLIQFFAHAQSKGYLHRDIKPANILIMPEPQKKSEGPLKANKKYCMNPESQLAYQNNQGQRTKKTTQEKFIKYKVCDFGFGTRKHEFSSKNIAGTACYASPKIRIKFNNTQACIAGNNFRDDVFSLGITLIQLASLQSAELNAPKGLLIKINNRYGIRFSQILQSMIEFDEEKRPDFLKLRQDYPNFIGLSHKVNKTKVTEKKKSNKIKMNEPQAIATPYYKPKSPSKNQIKLASPQLKIHLPTQKKPKECKNLKSSQKQEELIKKFQKYYTFVPNTDDYQRFKYLPQQRKQMGDEPLQRIAYYNINSKMNKLIEDKSFEDKKSKKAEKKNKKIIIQEKKEVKKDDKKEDKQEDIKVDKKEDKKKKVEYPKQSLQKKQIKFKYNDKVKTKRKSKNQSNFKIESINEEKNNKTKKINEINEEKKIIDRDSDGSQQRQSSQGTTSIKNTIWIQSTAAEEEIAKNLFKLCIPNLKQELISYISADLQLNLNKKDDKYAESSENQQIYSEKIKLNEGRSLIICVGHGNFLNIYYKLPKQRFQSLCLVFDEAQKLVYTQYSVQAQKLAIVTKRNKIKIISLQGIIQLIYNSITSNIKSIHADLLKTIGNYHTETNSINSFSFSDYLDSIFKVKDDGTFWENGQFLGNLPNKKVSIKFIRKLDNYIFLVSCQGQVFKYKINQSLCDEDTQSDSQKNKNGANINLVQYHKCKNTIIGFELLRSNTSKNTKIVVISAIGQVFILNENLQIIKIKNLSRNVLVACHISLQVLPDTEYFNICAVDCFGNLINEQGEVIGQTKVPDCLSIFVDYNRDLAYMTTQTGYIYQARIRPTLI